MRILLVDDEEDIHETIGGFLGDVGHEVISAADGVEALQRLADGGQMDLVFSDIRMPNMDGLQLLKAVRLRHPGLPVVLLTGFGDEGVAAEALRHGARNYFKKPVPLEQLLAQVHQLEERRELESQIHQDYRRLREALKCEGKSP